MTHPLFSTASIEPESRSVVESALQDQKTTPWDDIGASGVKRASGTLDEEFIPALRGRKSVRIYREMSLNDPVIASILFAIVQLLKAVQWNVEAHDDSPEQTKAKDFLESCMEDMSHSFTNMVGDILTFLIYGWSYFEITYKQRRGPWEKEDKYRSKHRDGLIGWRKIQIRSQETMQRWVFDEEGEVKGLLQIAPPRYKQRYIPIEKALHFRYGHNKNSPEGMSLLRPIYPLYFATKRLREFILVGVERDLAGMPVAKVPANYMDAQKGSKEYKVFEAFKKMVSNIRRDEHDGMVLPVQYDRNTKQPLFDFELMSAGGSKQTDAVALLDKFETAMLSTVMADFLKLGQSDTGSYAMHVSKTAIFRLALTSIAENIADEFNRHAVPKLFEINNMHLDNLPKIVPEAVDPPHLGELIQFMSGTAQMGMEWFPDADLEEYLRKVAHLPEMSEDVLEARREMSQHRTAGSYLQSSISLEGAKQQAGLVEQGMAPQQAEQHMQVPADETAQIQMQQQGQMQEQQMAMQMQQQEQQMAMQQEQMQAQAAMEQQKMQMQQQMQVEQMQMQAEQYPLQRQQMQDEIEFGHAQLDLKEREMMMQDPAMGAEEGEYEDEEEGEEPQLDPDTAAIIARLLGEDDEDDEGEEEEDDEESDLDEETRQVLRRLGVA